MQRKANEMTKNGQNTMDNWNKSSQEIKKDDKKQIQKGI